MPKSHPPRMKATELSNTRELNIPNRDIELIVRLIPFEINKLAKNKATVAINCPENAPITNIDIFDFLVVTKLSTTNTHNNKQK